MTNESKKTRALVGLCVSDLMRIFAPEAPIEGDAAMRDVYELFLDGLTNLKSIESEEFEIAKGLLMNIANIGLCVPMLDLDCEGSEDLVRDLFKVLMDATNAANATTISEEVIKVLSTMIEESADEDTPVPSDILFEVLSRLIDPARSSNPAAFKIACELVRKCEHQLHAPIQTFLTRAMHGTVDEEDELSQLSKRHVDIIEEIAVCDPTTLVTVWPSVTDDLQADDVSMRLRAVKLLGRVFAFESSKIAEEYPHLLLDFVRRFNDKAVEVRTEMVKWSATFLKTRVSPDAALSSVPASTVIKQVRERLHDFDDQVRIAAINALCDIADKPSSAELISVELMREIGERIKDKKSSVRKTALKRLCIVYRAYAQRCADDAPSWEMKRFDWIPCAFLRAITIPDVRLHTIEPVLAEIFPTKMSAESRSTFWLRALTLADDFTVRCLKHFLHAKSRAQADLREYFLFRAKSSKSSNESEAALAKIVDAISLHFAEPSKAKKSMLGLHAQKDGNIFRCIQLVLNPETSFSDAAKAEDDCLKRAKSSSQALDHEFVKLLLLKIQSAPFGREHVRGTLKAACKATRTMGNSKLDATSSGVIVALEHLCILAETFPKLFSGCGEEIDELLDSVDERTVTRTCKIVSEAAAALKLTPRRASIWEKLKAKCSSGDRKQAKLSTKALGLLQMDLDENVDAVDALSGATSGQLSTVYSHLADLLAEDACVDSDLPAVLGAVATIGSHYRDTFDLHLAEVEQYITHTLLTRLPSKGRIAVGVVSDIVMLQAHGLKALAKAAAHKSMADTPARAFTTRVLELLHTYADMKNFNRGGVFEDYAAADATHLCFTACKSIIIIARNTPLGMIKPSAWIAVSSFLHHCDSVAIKRELVGKLKKGLVVRASDPALPMMWAATLSMCLVDKDKTVRDAANEAFTNWVATQRNRSHSFAAQQAAKTKDDDGSAKFLLVHMPEYVLVYMVFLFVRHPLAPKNAEEGMADRGSLWRQIQLIFSAAVATLTQGTSGDGIPAACKILRRLKTTMDKVDPGMSDMIYTLSDLVLFVVVDYAGSKGWDTSKFPGHVVYPTQLFKTTAFMASGPPVKEGAQPGLGDYSHLPRGYVIVRSVPIASTNADAEAAKPAAKRSRAKASTSKSKNGKTLTQTKLTFEARPRGREMPDRAARRDAIIDVDDVMDTEDEFDDYESEDDYESVDEPSGALVVVSSPPRSPLTENNIESPKRKQRKTDKLAMGNVDMNAEMLDVGVDPDEGARRRRRR